jgi:hypothetical protein
LGRRRQHRFKNGEHWGRGENTGWSILNFCLSFVNCLFSEYIYFKHFTSISTNVFLALLLI